MAASPTPDRVLAGRTVLAVLAHPDDESLACGGTLARAADAGARVVLLCGSRGERGSVSDPTLLDGQELAAVRTRELYEAAAILGISDVIVKSHPDGDLRWAHVPAFHQDIVNTINAVSPDAVITFDDDGLYWHLDHIGVHERTFTAVKSFGTSAPPLYYVTMPAGAMQRIADAAHEKIGAPPDSSFWGILPERFGEHARQPDFVVDVRPWTSRKLAALRCHRTQMGPRNPAAWITDTEAELWLGYEQFRCSPLPSTMPRLLEAVGEPPGDILPLVYST